MHLTFTPRESRNVLFVSDSLSASFVIPSLTILTIKEYGIR